MGDEGGSSGSEGRGPEGAALRAREQELQVAFDAAGMGTWSWDLATGRVRGEWADSGARGLVRAAFDGTYEEFVGRVHADDRARLQETMARAVADGSEYEIELRVVWPDGTVRWVASKGKVVSDERGTPVRVVGVPM